MLRLALVLEVEDLFTKSSGDTAIRFVFEAPSSRHLESASTECESQGSPHAIDLRGKTLIATTLGVLDGLWENGIDSFVLINIGWINQHRASHLGREEMIKHAHDPATERVPYKNERWRFSCCLQQGMELRGDVALHNRPGNGGTSQRPNCS